MGLDRSPVSIPTFWEDLYAEGRDAWDIGMPAPPLVAWLDAGGRFEVTPVERGTQVNAAAPVEGAAPVQGAARIAVPGAGRGHDARLLARLGHRVWGFDFAAAALAEATALAQRDGVAVTYEQRDIFTLAAAYSGFFDGVWEYTCFCAIDPRRREEYVRLVPTILRPGGTLLACFFPLREGEDGPPFAVSRPEIERVLAPHFRIVESGPPASSVEPRRGLEWLVRAERRG